MFYLHILKSSAANWAKQLGDCARVEPQLEIAEDGHEAVGETAREKRGRHLESRGHGEEAAAAAEPRHVPEQHERDVRHVSGDVEEDREAGGLGLAEVI